MSFDHRESLDGLGFSAFFQAQFAALLATNEAPPNAVVARILCDVRGQYLVSSGVSTRRAVLAGRLKHHAVRVCVGDFVLLEADTVDDLARVVRVFERNSLFQRKAPGETSEAQLIAANVDLAIVVCALASEDADPHALRHGLNPRRIERYLWAIRAAPARAVVVVNKADLSSAQYAKTTRAGGTPQLGVSCSSYLATPC